MQHILRHLGLSAGLIAASLALTAEPAPAQFMQLFGFPSAEPPPPLPPDVVAGRLTRMGFKVVRLRRAQQGYVAEATDLAGRSFRLLVDPIDGSVLQHVALPGPTTGPERELREPREPRRGSIEPPPSERGAPRSKPSAQQSAQQPRPAEPAPAAQSEAAPAPAKPAPPFIPKAGPGFANGVPINPLD